MRERWHALGVGPQREVRDADGDLHRTV